MSRTKKNWDHLVNNDGSYAIDIKNGIWPGSGVANKGQKGTDGDPGPKGTRGPRGPQGKKGDGGPQGDKGDLGPKGDSAFDVAVEEGFVGTPDEWVASLVGEKGDKGEDGLKGDFDDLTQAQKDSLKGEQGLQGEKGDASGIFEFKGSVDDLAALNALSGPHAAGDVYKTDDTDDLYVYDGAQFVLLSEALDVVKGQKGEVGEQGEDGEDGQKGEKGTVGEKGDDGVDGDKGDDGKSAYDLAVELDGFTGTDVEYLASLKGETGAEGQKGEDGSSAYELSQKGLPVDDVVGEDVWLESLKGEKGEAADPTDFDNYYTKGQTTQLLDELPDPRDSYDINFMPPENVISSGESASFSDQDQAHVLYNPGLIGVESGATIVDSPVPAPFVVRNTVISDPSSLRDSDYVVLQEVIEIHDGSISSVVRTAQPGSNVFSPWSEATFSPGNYYDKTEVDALVNAINYTFELDALEPTLKLTDKDGAEQSVALKGKNGITVSSTADGIEIDGEALLPVPQFLGVLQDAQDPDSIATDPVDGQYFIYGYTGVTVSTDPDAQPCTPGDWCIYKTDKWLFLDISADTGVMTVNVTGGLLDLNDDDPANLVIDLDPSDVVTPPELDDYLKIETFTSLSASRRIGDLSDVEIDYSRVNFGGSASRSAFGFNVGDNAEPTLTGQRGSMISTNTLRLAKQSSTGDTATEFYNNINVNADPPQLIRVKASSSASGLSRVDNVVSKTNAGSYYEIVFKTALVPLFSSGYDGEVVFDIATGSADDGDILVFDSTDQTWKAGEAGDYVKKDGDTMTGALTVDKSKFKVTRGDGADLFEVDSYNNHVLYYGGIHEDNDIVNKKYLEDEFLPLGGGTLHRTFSDSPTLVVKGSPDLNPAIGNNILKVVTSANDEVLTLRGDKEAIFGDNVTAPSFSVSDKGSIKADVDSTRINTSTDKLTLEFAENPRLVLEATSNSLCGTDDSDPALTWGTNSVDILKPLLISGDHGEDGQVLVSKGSGVIPEWQDLSNLDEFVRKDGSTMTGDLGMQGNKILSLAPSSYDGAPAEFGLTISLQDKSTRFNHLKIDGRNNHLGMVDINDDGNGAHVIIKGREQIVSPKSDDTYGFQVTVAGLGGSSAFQVNGDGAVLAGPDSGNPFLATETNHVCTKAFFDAELAKIPTAATCLPLAGGTLTGQLNTSALIKSTRTSGGSFEVSNNGRQNVMLHSNGNLILRSEATGTGSVFAVNPVALDAGGSFSAFRVTAEGKVKAGPNSGEPFMATSANDVATKKYVDTNSGRVVLHTSSSAPSNEDRGTLLLTTDNKFYIYV